MLMMMAAVSEAAAPMAYGQRSSGRGPRGKAKDERPRGKAKEDRPPMEKGLDSSKTDPPQARTNSPTNSRQMKLQERRPEVHATLSPAVAAEAGIARAVARESKLATQWVRDEGQPQEELPADAVAQILKSPVPFFVFIFFLPADAVAQVLNSQRPSILTISSL
jgi:hypothetical protein